MASRLHILSLVVSLTVASVAGAVETNCPGGACCVNDVAPGANCTANDLTFVLVGLGIQSDGCTGDSDTLDIELRAIIENTTAQTRYDVGVWVATDSDPNADGALTGGCARETLTPVSGVTGSLLCADVDLTCGGGGYYSADGDFCGDLVTQNSAPDCGQVDDPTIPTDGPCTTADTIPDASVLDFVVPITVLCNDTDNDGFSNLDVCLTYGNQNNQVDFGGANGTCDSAAELEPGTNAKCQCEDNFNSNIPVPDLTLSSCTCPGPVRPGLYTTCTYSYTNADLPNCTPNPSTLAQFRCGTGAFFRFDADYDQANGSVSNISATSGAATDTGDVLSWSPDSTAAANATPDNIILENQSGSLTFRFNVDSDVADGTLAIPVSTLWSADGTFATTSTQSLATTCNVVVQATWASVGDVRAVRAGDATAIEWSTAAEAGSVDFTVERRVGDRFVSVGRVPAVGLRPGGDYRVVDRSAPDGTATWRIVERDARGGERVHGPFTLDAAIADPGAEPRAEPRRPSAQAARPAITKASGRRPDNRSRVVRATAVDLAITENGVHAVPVATLAGAFGQPVPRLANALRGGRLQLTHRGTPIAHWLSADDNLLRFHVDTVDDPLAAHDAVRVAPGDGVAPGRRASLLGGAQIASIDATTLAEDDLQPRTYLATDPLEDFWYWAVLAAGHPTLGDFATEIAAPDAVATGAAELVVDLRGFSPGGLRVAVDADGDRLGEAAWDGDRLARFTFAVDPASLVDGSLDLRLEALTGNVLLDAAELRFRRAPRALDGQLRFVADADGTLVADGFADADIAVWAIDEPGHPAAVDAAIERTTGGYRARFAVEAGSTYLAVDGSGRHAPAALVPVGDDPTESWSEAEQLVVTVPELAGAAERLAAHRASRGVDSRVALWDEIVAHHGDGVPSPRALRAALGAARADGRLRSVLLLGAGTFDVHDRFGAGDNLLPPLMVATAYGLQPADGRFVDHGAPAPGVPTLAIGRVPAATAAEADAWVDKVIAAETSSAAERPWLVLSDNADIAGDFPTDGDALATRLGAVHRSLGSELVAAVRADLLDDFADYGVITWLGHGGLDRLADEGLLTTADVPALAGDGAGPVVAALTCNIGYFAFPAFRSLGELLVVSPTGGAHALIAPSGLSAHGEARRLGTHLLDALSAAPPSTPVGAAWRSAVDAYLAAGGDAELVSIYLLLGDPESPVSP